MNYQIKIKNVNTVDQIEGYWTEKDIVELLGKFGFPDVSDTDKESLNDLLSMAITDYEPKEAAAIVLEYKLADHLNDGQIQQISNEMLIDKVCEEYPEIGLHAILYHVNQLLFKAYNGKFPNAKATIVECTITPLEGEADKELSKENVLKLFSKGLSDSNIINRLFDPQMHENADFPEAEDILWDLSTTDKINYIMNTSENWLKKEDFIDWEFESSLEEVKDEV
jgi:hypothetical protein